MKKLLVLSLILLAAFGQIFADQQTSIVSVRSVVTSYENANPGIVVSITTQGSNFAQTDETSSVTGVNLTEDGSYSFVLMTSQEVNLNSEIKSTMEIEIVADGFHLYDYDYSGALSGSSMDESSIRMMNAVPLLSTTPSIDIPTFSGKNENVSVSASGEHGNKIGVTFNKGITKADLVLGTFSIEWKGKKPLDPGIYKAKVIVNYNIP